MSLKEELGLKEAIRHQGHEAIMSVVLTGAILAKEGDRILRPFGITDSQFNVLMLVKYQSEEGQINQTQLGRMLLVNRSNVTGLIDRMEQAGWVQRSAEKGDRRVKQISLTNKGTQLVNQAEKAYFERLEEIVNPIPKNQVEQLLKALEKIRGAIRDESSSS